MRKVRLTALALLISVSSLWSHAEPRDAIEEIVVTATKREASVMEVPASVTAFTSDVLDERKIRDLTEINMQVPNFHSGMQNGQALISVRGIGQTQTQGVAESAVAQHVDGVFVPRTTSQRGVYFDLESLEALRGPQGTLYGRNATGGTLNLRTAKPSEEFEGRVGLLVGDYDRAQVSAVLSGPLADAVLGRVAVISDGRDNGYTKNLLAGFDDVDTEKVLAAKAALRFLPSDSLTIDALAIYENREGRHAWPSLTAPSDALFPIYVGAQFTTEPHEIYSEQDNEDEREDMTLIVTVDWGISDNASLKSVTGYIDSDWRQFTDSDGVGVFSVTADTGLESATFSQELNLDLTLVDNQIELLIGGFFYRDELEWFNYLPLNFVDHAFGLPPFTSVVETAVDQDTTAYALFADATYHVTDGFRIYGGARWSYEEKDADIAALQVIPLCGFGLPLSELDDDWDDVSPRIGVQVDFSETTMVYGQFQSGFRSGGFDSSSCNDPYEPEQVKAFEVGLKSTLAGGRATISATVFFYDYEDLQVQQIEGLQLNVTNAAQSEVYGLELESSFIISDGFQAAIRYSFLSAEYDEFVDCDTLLFPGNCSAPATALGLSVFEDLSGNPLNRAPEHTFGVSLDYTRLTEFGELGFRVDATWVGDIQHRQFNRPEDEQSAYTLVNLFATYRPEAAQNLLFRVFGKNVTNEEYFVTSLAVGATSVNRLTSPWGPPRTWGVEVVYEFN